MVMSTHNSPSPVSAEDQILWEIHEHAQGAGRVNELEFTIGPDYICN